MEKALTSMGFERVRKAQRHKKGEKNHTQHPLDQRHHNLTSTLYSD